MSIKKFGQTMMYLLFAVLVCAAFYLSGKLTSKSQEKNETLDGIRILCEDMEISAFLVAEGQVWVGSSNGIYIFDANTLEIIRQVEDLEIIYTSGMAQSLDGTIWVGHESGLTGFLKDGRRIDFHSPDLPKGRINTVCFDGSALWCGSYHGAARLELEEGQWKVVQTYTQQEGLICDSVNVICAQGEAIWFASYLNHVSGGITIWERNHIQYLSVEDGLPHFYITSLLSLDENTMLAGTGYMEEGGLAVIEKSEMGYEVIQVFEKKDGIPGEKVRYLYRDSHGYLWITTEYDGVLVLDDTEHGLTAPLEGLILTRHQGLSDDEIKCIAQTDQYIWLGGKLGLTLIEQDKFLKWMEEKGWEK
ncbi:MAG: two-component regulator propeller domain-containing protein [Lachnospiraceae bacterium]